MCVPSLNVSISHINRNFDCVFSFERFEINNEQKRVYVTFIKAKRGINDGVNPSTALIKLTVERPKDVYID